MQNICEMDAIYSTFPIRLVHPRRRYLLWTKLTFSQEEHGLLWRNSIWETFQPEFPLTTTTRHRQQEPARCKEVIGTVLILH